MKPTKWILTALLLAGLVVGSLVACGGGAKSTSPTEAAPTKAAQPAPTMAAEAQPTQTEPTTAPEPTIAPVDTPVSESAGDTGLDTNVLSTSSDLNSYRSKMTITTKGTKDGQEVTESLDFVTEYTKEPLAQHIVMSGTALEEGGAPGNIEMYQTAETMYMKMGDQWLSVPAGEGEQITQGLITPEDLLGDTCGWKKERDTELGGIKVNHYTTSKDQMDQCAPTALLTQVGELTDAGGDLYVAIEENYVAQMDFFLEGTGMDLTIGGADEAVQQGRMEFHFEMSDVNQPFTIEVPEEALAAGAMPEDIPIPADAEEASNMFGMISFKSASTPAEIADFYKAEMPNNGWTQVSADELGGMFMLEYTKDARKASFVINTDTDTNKTSVLITIEE